jgi:hypothetical protein
MSDPVDKLTAQVMGEPQEPVTEPNTTTDPVGTAEEWYDNLDDAARTSANAYVTSETAKLKSALDEERKQRRAYEKQVKELAGKVTGDDATKTKLEELGNQLSEANLKAAFYEGAVDVPNLPAKRYAAAYKIAKIDSLIDDDGSVDWKALQEQHDYLFAAPAQEQQQRKPGSAGAGLGSKPQPSKGMNDLIRGN